MSQSEQQLAVMAASLHDMPVETVIEIFQSLDIAAVYSMSRVSKRFRKIVETNWTIILRPVIDREMTPIAPFLHVLNDCSSKPTSLLMKPSPPTDHDEVPSSAEDSTSDDGSLSDEDDDNDSFDDTDSLGDGDDASDSSSESSDDDTGNIDDLLALEDRLGAGSHVPGEDVLPDQWSSGLSYATVMRICRLTKAWEQEFHRLRFACPHHSRTLRPHELQRLRHSLYAWWRYTSCFHDTTTGIANIEDLSRDSPVVRMEFVRQFSTSQLHEIRDMWETIKSAVGREICPSISAVRRQSGNVLSWAEAARVGWGDPAENSQVLGTIMKLRPEDILYLLVNRHRFATKASIIQFARFKNPWIEDSVETFSDSIQWALWERERQLVAEYGLRALHRRWYFPPLGFFPRPWGGIVDYKKAETEQLREVYNRDAGGEGVSYWIDDHGGPRRYLARQVPTGRLVVSRSW